MHVEAMRIGERISDAAIAQMKGYDHNFVLSRGTAPFDALTLVGSVVEPSSGRKMTVYVLRVRCLHFVFA